MFTMKQVWSVVLHFAFILHLNVRCTSQEWKIDNSTLEKYQQTKEICIENGKNKYSKGTYNWLDRECCAGIYTNHCLEKRMGLRVVGSIFQSPITQRRCMPHLEKPKLYCDVDIKTYGYKTAMYSICFIQAGAYFNKFQAKHEHDIGFLTQDSIEEAKRSSDNDSYCCFMQSICNCYNHNYLEGCQDIDASRFLDASITGEEYCQCTHDAVSIPLDTICPNMKHCMNAVPDDFLEYRDLKAFMIFLFTVSFVNFLIYYCFFGESSFKLHRQVAFDYASNTS